MTDFLTQIIRRDTPQETLSAWLAELDSQIAAVRIAEAYYEAEITARQDARLPLRNALQAFILNGTPSNAPPVYHAYLTELAAFREVMFDLGEITVKLSSQRLTCQTYLNTHTHAQQKVAEAAQAEAARIAQHDKEKQEQYEFIRSKEFFERGNTDAASWPDRWQEREAILAKERAAEHQQQTEHAAQRQQAVDAAQVIASKKVETLIDNYTKGSKKR